MAPSAVSDSGFEVVQGAERHGNSDPEDFHSSHGSAGEEYEAGHDEDMWSRAPRDDPQDSRPHRRPESSSRRTPARSLFPSVSYSDLPRPARPLTVLDMPTPGSRQAPKTFRGAYYEIERFIEHYERLLRQYNVVTGKDKCHSIIQYCSQRIGEFIASTREYVSNDWAGLRAALLKYYNADRVHSKYKPSDVVAFVSKSRRRRVENLTQWNQYYTRFVTRAGQLANAKKLSEQDEAAYFWLGIHPTLSEIFEHRILAKRPKHDLKEAYPIKLVCEVAEEYFQRQKFTNMRLDAEKFGFLPEEEVSDSGTDSDSSTSDSEDSEREDRRRRRRKAKRKERSRRKEEKRHARTAKMSGNAGEVANLVRQLNTMKPEEPIYASLYYKALSLDTTGRVDDVIHSRPVPPNQPQTRPAQTTQPAPRNTTRDAPPHLQAPVRSVPVMSAAASGEQTCYGCNEPGHRISECVKINKILQEGRAKRHPVTNRLVLPNDGLIRRGPGESLAAAIDRITIGEANIPASFYCAEEEPLERRAASYLARIESYSEDEAEYAGQVNDPMLVGYHEVDAWSPSEAEDYEADTEEEETIGDFLEEDEDGNVYRVEVYPVTRTEKSTTAARKERMEVPQRRAGLRQNVTRHKIPSKFRGLPSAEPWVERKGKNPRPPSPPIRTSTPRPEPPRPPQQRTSASAGLPPGSVALPRSDISMSEASDPQQKGKGIEGPSPDPAVRPEPLPTHPSASLPSTPGQTHPRPERIPWSAYERPPVLRPVEARKPRVRFSQDTEGPNETRATPRREEPRAKESPFHNSDFPQVKPRGPARVAPVVSETNTGDVLNRLMDGMHAPLSLREVLGVSKELRAAFQEAIKPKSVGKQDSQGNAVVGALTVPEQESTRVYGPVRTTTPAADNRGLIELVMNCEGHDICAIIDTGSQLNVMSDRKMHEVLPGRIIDTSAALFMTDAGGRKTPILGVVRDVELGIRDVISFADIYIVDSSMSGARDPYELLLGRPWQRGNQISIEEKKAGTRLVIPNPNDPDEKPLIVPVGNQSVRHAHRATGASAYLVQEAATYSLVQVSEGTKEKEESSTSAENACYAVIQSTEEDVEHNRVGPKGQDVPRTLPIEPGRAAPKARDASTTYNILSCWLDAFTTLVLQTALKRFWRTDDSPYRNIQDEYLRKQGWETVFPQQISTARSLSSTHPRLSELSSLLYNPASTMDPPPRLNSLYTVFQTSQGPNRRLVPYSIQVVDATDVQLPYHVPPADVHIPAGSPYEELRHASALGWSEHLNHVERRSATLFNASGVVLVGGTQLDEHGHQYRTFYAPKGTSVLAEDAVPRAEFPSATVMIHHPETGRMFIDINDLFMKGYTQTAAVSNPRSVPVPGHNGIAALPYSAQDLRDMLSSSHATDGPNPPPAIGFSAPVVSYASLSPTRPPSPEELEALRRHEERMRREENAQWAQNESSSEIDQLRFIPGRGVQTMRPLLLPPPAGGSEEAHAPDALERQGTLVESPTRALTEPEAGFLQEITEEAEASLERASSEHAPESESPEGARVTNGAPVAPTMPLVNGISAGGDEDFPILRYPPSRSSTASTPPPARMLTTTRPASPVITRATHAVSETNVFPIIEEPPTPPPAPAATPVPGLHLLADAAASERDQDVDMENGNNELESGEVRESEERSVFFLSKILNPQPESPSSSRATTDPRLAKKEEVGEPPKRPGTPIPQPFRTSPGQSSRAAQGRSASRPSIRRTPALVEPAGRQSVWSPPTSPTRRAFYSGATALDHLVRTLNRISSDRSQSRAAALPDIHEWGLEGRDSTSASEGNPGSDSSDSEDVYAASLRPTSVGELASLAARSSRPWVSAPSVVSPDRAASDAPDSPVPQASPHSADSPLRALTESEAEAIPAQETEEHDSFLKNDDSSSGVDLPSLADVSDLDDVDFFEKIDIGASQRAERATATSYEYPPVLPPLAHDDHTPANFGDDPLLSPSTASSSMPSLQPIDEFSNDGSTSESNTSPDSSPRPVVPPPMVVHDGGHPEAHERRPEYRRLRSSEMWELVDEDWGEFVADTGFEGEINPPSYASEPPQSPNAYLSEIADYENAPHEDPHRFDHVNCVMRALRKGLGIIVRSNAPDAVKVRSRSLSSEHAYKRSNQLTAINDLSRWAKESVVATIGYRITLPFAHPMAYRASLTAAVREVSIGLKRIEQLDSYDVENETQLRQHPEIHFAHERPSTKNRFSPVGDTEETARLLKFLAIHHPDAVVINEEGHPMVTPGSRLHNHIPPSLLALPELPRHAMAPFNPASREHRGEHGQVILDMGEVILETRRTIATGLGHLIDWVRTNDIEETVKRDMRDILGERRVPLNPFLYIEEAYYLTGVINILDLDSRQSESETLESLIYNHPRVSYQLIRGMMRLGYLGGAVPAMADAALGVLRSRGRNPRFY